MPKRIDNNGHARLSGYVSDSGKKWWQDMLKTVAKREGLRNPGMGVLFDRLAIYGLRQDIPALKKFARVQKRWRDEDPAEPNNI